MLEKIFNLFVFVTDDIIHELGVTVHEMSGTDAEKVSFLQSQVDADFEKAARFPIPDRYTLKDQISGESITALKYEKLRVLMRMNLHTQIFEEIFKALSATADPLCCMTPIANGRSQIDRIEEFQVIENKEEEEEVKSVEFHSTDYIFQYLSEEGFDLSQLLNDDYLLAIKLLYNNNHYVSALKLMLSFIDTVAYLEFGDARDNFQQWLDLYTELSTIDISSNELWEMRNSLLHMTNHDSRKVLKGEVRRLMFYIGTLRKGLPTESDEGKYFNLKHLINTILTGVEKWTDSYNSNSSKFKDFIERYDRVVSDSRYETVIVE